MIDEVKSAIICDECEIHEYYVNLNNRTYIEINAKRQGWTSIPNEWGPNQHYCPPCSIPEELRRY